jgi:hypothetical protein
VPKKIDYQGELAILKDEPDNALRPITTRVPVSCLRKLYELCDRGNLDLSALVRQILEEQSDLYLGGQQLYSGIGKHDPGVRQETSVLLRLSPEVKELADKASEGLAIDLPTLLRQVVTEALPEWVIRGSKARLQRRQALEQAERPLTRERALWERKLLLAREKHRNLLRYVASLIEEGNVYLEFDTDEVLYMVLDYGTTAELEGGKSRHGGIRALQQLIDQGVVIREERHQGSSSKWRLAL